MSSVGITTTEQIVQVDTTSSPVAVTIAPQPVQVETDYGRTLVQTTNPVTNLGTPGEPNLSLATGSNLTLGNAGELKVTDDLTAIDSILFDLAAGEVAAIGKLAWNDTDGTLEFGLKGGNVVLQIGQEQVVLVKDYTNTGLPEGAVVYQHGTHGSNITVGLAQATTEELSAQVLGVMTEPTTGGAKGFCTTFGLVRGIDTSTLTEGAAIWLSPTVAGGMTTTKPANGYHLVLVGYCLRSHANNGVIFVKVANGYELDELHDVNITSPSVGQVLTYNGSLWVNSAPAGDITGITVSSPITGGGTSGSVAIGFDQSAQNTTNDTRYARLGAANAFTVGGHTITNAAAAVVPLTIQGAASQSTYLLGFKDSTGAVKSYVGALGAYVAGPDSTTYSTFGGVQGNANICLQDATAKGLVIKGATSQSANLTEWQASDGTIRSLVNANGALALGQGTVFSYANGSAGTALLSLQQNPLTGHGLIVRGRNSNLATDMLFETQTNPGTQITGLSAAGALTLNLGGNAGLTNIVGVTIKGAASQSANLQEWQNSSGTVLAKITSAGSISAQYVDLANGYGQMSYANSGGNLSMTRQTAANGNPGANKGVLYFRDGTNAGTLKLVVRAGAAGAETTILDNIPQ